LARVLSPAAQELDARSHLGCHRNVTSS